MKPQIKGDVVYAISRFLKILIQGHFFIVLREHVRVREREREREREGERLENS